MWHKYIQIFEYSNIRHRIFNIWIYIFFFFITNIFGYSNYSFEYSRIFEYSIDLWLSLEGSIRLKYILEWLFVGTVTPSFCFDFGTTKYQVCMLLYNGTNLTLPRRASLSRSGYNCQSLLYHQWHSVNFQFYSLCVIIRSLFSSKCALITMFQRF